jgi:DNA-binding response OmpR family regulator
VAKPARILVIDDDAAFRELLLLVLTAAGYEVRAVPHGTAALALLQRPEPWRPDLILLDLALPDTHGLVLCADLRARVDVPIIICSATKRRWDRILGFKLGADDFLAKPFDLEELEARVEAILRRAEWSGSLVG